MKRALSFFIFLLFLINSSLFAWHHIFHQNAKSSFDLNYEIFKNIKKEIENCKLCLSVFFKIPENKSIDFLKFFQFSFQDLKLGFYIEKLINNISRGPPTIF